MTDKERIKLKIEKMQDALMDENSNFASAKDEGAYQALCELDFFIDSLEEEPVNEDLHKEVERAKAIYANVDNPSLLPMLYAQTGANWQKEQIMKDAINAKIEQPFPTPLLPRLRLDLLVLEYYCSEHGFKHGDKVKVIIIKDE